MSVQTVWVVFSRLEKGKLKGRTLECASESLRGKIQNRKSKFKFQSKNFFPIQVLFKSSSLPYSISHFVRPDDTIIIFNSQTQSPLPAVLVRYSEGVSTRTLFQIRWPREPLRNLLPFHPAIAKTHVNSAETLRVWDELLYKLEIWDKSFTRNIRVV